MFIGLKSWLKRHEKAVLTGLISASASSIFWLCAAKYARFGYNGIDLAYFNQVFWNTVRGRFFQQSIHPHLSLGDHAELLILPLAPFYSVWQDPRMLLALQALALALCAWPVWLLVRDGSATRRHSLLPLGFALAWLLNPLPQNIALFEFHILPFAIFPLLMATLAYRRGRTTEFLMWSLGALIVREDTALVVAAFSLLAWSEKRALWWRWVPLILGVGWFIGAMTLIRQFSPGGGYKFAIYYAWLTDAWRQPVTLLAHLFTFANIEMLLGFLMAAAFLPLFAWRPLLLAAGPLAQILLGAPGGGEIVLETHYSSLFLPALILASIDGYAAMRSWLGARTERAWIIPAREMRAVLPVFGLVAVFYSDATFGPIPTALTRALAPLPTEAASAAEMIAQIPPDAAVAASYAVLPQLSARENLFSAHYIFLGVTQFAEKPYPVPEGLGYVLFDERDLGFYAAQFKNTSWSAPHHEGGLERLASAAGKTLMRQGSLALYENSDSGETDLSKDMDNACLDAYEKTAVIVLDGDRSIRLASRDHTSEAASGSCRKMPGSLSK